MGEDAKRGVESLMEAVAEIKLEVATTKNDIGMLKNDISNVKDNIAGVKKDISDLSNEVDNLASEVSTVRNNVNELNIAVSSLTIKINDLTTNVDKISRSTNVIYRALFEESLTHPSMLTILKQNETSIKTMAGKIDGLEAKSTTHSNKRYDSGSYDLLKDGKKTVIGTVLALIAASSIGFVASAVWDSVVRNIRSSNDQKYTVQPIKNKEQPPNQSEPTEGP